jgi:putative glutathione S-transferase
MTTARSETEHEIAPDGAFRRQENAFRGQFGDGPGELPAVAGRYRPVQAQICPWAHRSLIVRRVLGLDDAISVAVTNPVRTSLGWEFSDDPDGVDPVLRIRYLNEAYEATDHLYRGRATVPALVDVTTGRVVSNDYHRLTNQFEVDWAPLHAPGAGAQ